MTNDEMMTEKEVAFRLTSIRRRLHQINAIKKLGRRLTDYERASRTGNFHDFAKYDIAFLLDYIGELEKGV
jgi:hypothetical protein